MPEVVLPPGEGSPVRSTPPGEPSSGTDRPVHHSILDGSAKTRKEIQQQKAGITAKMRRQAMVYTVKPNMPLLEQVWMTFEVPSFSRLAFVYAQFSVCIIMLSTVSFCLETEINCKPFSVSAHSFVTPENCETWETAWSACEYVAVTCFSLELSLRLVSSPSKFIFLQGVMNWVDLIAILPFYVDLIVTATAPEGSESGSGETGGPLDAFSVFRVVRLVRVFRVFKMGKSSSGMRMMASTMAESAKVLFVLIFMVAIAVIVFSSAVFSFEQSGKYKDDFQSIPRTFWWALVTMTTVGYGDIYPATPWGRFVAVFTMFSGIIIVALPITVIGANFEKQFEKQYFADALTSAVVLEDQSVDYHELWSLMEKLNMRGNLLIPMPASITDLKELVAQYDVQRKGKLDSEDWGCFILDVVCEAHEFTAVTINKVVVDVNQMKQEMKAFQTRVEQYREESDRQHAELKALLLGKSLPSQQQRAAAASTTAASAGGGQLPNVAAGVAGGAVAAIGQPSEERAAETLRGTGTADVPLLQA